MTVSLLLTADEATASVRIDALDCGATIDAPIRWATFGGASGVCAYESVEIRSGDIVADAVTADGRIRITDTWREVDDRVALRRAVRVLAGEPVRIDLEIAVVHDPDDRWFVPGMISAPAQHSAEGSYTFADDRLGYPVAAHWSPRRARVVWLARTSLPTCDAAPVRDAGETRFRRDTDLGCIGFRTGTTALLAGWPVAELDHSSQLDGARRGFETFAGGEEDFDIVIEYELGWTHAASFPDAVRVATARAVELAAPVATAHDTTLAESIDLRLDSAAQTYAVSPSGFAGFVLNFDPENGYDSQAKAFGASFADHEMGGSHDILEYGFTGRQLDLACSLAARDPEGWGGKGRLVVDSFVERMTRPGGWIATLFDIRADEPLYAIGDARGTIMHYLGRFDVPGTYTRMMTEAGGDLLRNIALHLDSAHDVRPWIDAANGLGRFLLGVQNSDGSWYRGYAPDGTPVVGGEWFGDTETTGKSATGAVVPFLLDLAAASFSADATFVGELNAAAERAGAYLFDASAARGEYRGGTLDNPNDVDKEAALIAMRAFLSLHDAGVSGRWISAATQAAWFALGWHSLWQVPLVPGTAVAAAGVRSVGWGGINSVWGVGVTDIYSLFFAGDLHRLGQLTGTPEFSLVAELIAHSSIEMLATPARPLGFSDSGMQPEGISFCDQGRDDGLIRKGDMWGGLGWPYTAGTTGLGDYLSAVRDDARISTTTR